MRKDTGYIRDRRYALAVNETQPRLGGDPVTPEQARTWRLAGHSPADAHAFVAVGARLPSMVPAGVSVQDARTASRWPFLGMVTEGAPLPHWAGVSLACQNAVNTLTKDRARVRAGIDLARALTERADTRRGASPHAGGPCSAFTCPAAADAVSAMALAAASEWADLAVATRAGLDLATALVAVREARDVDWADLATCRAAGLGVEEALATVRAGADMEALRVMAALA